MGNPAPRNAEKIAILGIENAGKTSIIKVLTHEFDLLMKLKPTVSVERTFIDLLGKELVIWDFGGQETYRDKYLESPDRYFNDISYIFYVLDIQDPTLLGSNIMYFQGVYRRIKKYSPKAKFILLFHKLDPNLKLPEVAKKLQKEFLEAVTPDIDEKLGEEAEFKLFPTSIFNPRSIVYAFTKSLFTAQDLSEAISNVLKHFVEQYNVYFASLITSSFFEIGYYADPKFIAEKGEVLNEIFNEFYKNFQKWLDPTTPIVSKAIDQGDLYLLSTLFIIDTAAGKVPLYLAVGYNRENVLKSEMEPSVAKLNENLGKLFENIDLKELIVYK